MPQTIKEIILNEIKTTVNDLKNELNIEIPADYQYKVEYPPDFKFGDYSSPAAMDMARYFKLNPRQLASDIVKKLLENNDFKKLIREIKIEGPGFINFFISEYYPQNLLNSNFSFSEYIKNLFPKKEKPSFIFEFVSANPTGPLNIVSARAAAVGDSICRVLSACGYNVYKEYYVNDFGNQVKLLGESFAYRFAEINNKKITLPADCYQGEYITEIVKNINKATLPEFILNIPDDENLFLSWVQQAGEYFSCIGIEKLLDTHKNDLSDFRVSFDNFFSEKSLHENNSVENTFLELKEKNQIYEKDGAWFFKSSDFGDDKDRVIKRNDGRPTYLLADIAYHKNKADRKFDNIYDMWGPDHHGYIARMKAAMQALEILINHDFKVLIVQQVNLIEDKKPIVMSKRLGKFQTMKDLTEKIPVDVCRYFFNTRSQSSHLDFDLELALTESNQNPVYYIQYAHARIHSIFRETTINYNDNLILNEIPEQWFFTAKRNDLLFYLLKFPEELYEISKNLEVHRLSSYLYQTASLFTAFYHEKENHILEKLKNNPNEGIFLLSICKFTADTIAYGLNLLGVSAPQKM